MNIQFIRDLYKASNDNSGNNKTLVRLGTFSYDIRANRTIQVFNLEKQTLISYEYVLFEFLSNHGHPTQTCVYR